MALTDPSKRLEAIPPYKFAELERQVADKRAAGIDVISLGIGDPDHATYPHVVEAMQSYERAEALRPPGNDDALLRWNACVRFLTRYQQLRPASEEQAEIEMLE